VGVPFAAGLNVTGDGVSGKFYGDDFTMKITSGSLPPGLKLSLPGSEWTVTGTPTKAGTYPFTVQFAPTQDAPEAGPPGTQQLTITIGTGNADRLDLTGAIWSPHSVNKTLQIQGFDANFGGTYTVFVTANGTQLGTFTESSAWQDAPSRTTSGCRPARRPSRPSPARGRSPSRTAWAGQPRSQSP